jgi:hypothetical protein
VRWMHGDYGGCLGGKGKYGVKDVVGECGM